MEIKLKVDFVDMDKIILTRQSGDTFTIPYTKRNEEFFDFFHGKDKSQPQEEVNKSTYKNDIDKLKIKILVWELLAILTAALLAYITWSYS